MISGKACVPCQEFWADRKKLVPSSFKIVKLQASDDDPSEYETYRLLYDVKYLPTFIWETEDGKVYYILREYKGKQSFLDALKKAKERRAALSPNPLLSTPSKDNPAYNLEGSWTDIRDKAKLVVHLAEHDNHGNYTKTHLSELTINQLWWLHDTEHGWKESSTRPVVQSRRWRLCPT